MQEDSWPQVISLAEALNSSVELQEEFQQDPAGVLSRYGIELSDDELADIERILEICAGATTEHCIVPLPRERPRIRTNGEDEN